MSVPLRGTAVLSNLGVELQSGLSEIAVSPRREGGFAKATTTLGHPEELPSEQAPKRSGDLVKCAWVGSTCLGGSRYLVWSVRLKSRRATKELRARQPAKNDATEPPKTDITNPMITTHLILSSTW